MTESSHELVPTSLAIAAMRDSGYRNTAYAIAELIDNAIQARARSVELLCYERQQYVQHRTRRNIHKIAVLDNGTGMSSDVLSAALQFGNGQYLADRSGIGRFGMGLPSSSISQCRRVEVWTWQNGPESAIYSFIDLSLVEAEQQSTVPTPVPSEIPDEWLSIGDSFDATGTLIVWSELDRCPWKTGNTIIRNSEFLVGRMYRRFIETGRTSIRLVSFTNDPVIDISQDKFAEVNDPLYLMVPSSTPDPYGEEAMFRPDGDAWEIDTQISYRNQVFPVRARFAIAKEEARNKRNAGNTKYGRHAKRNVGISLVRAERELELDISLVIQHDTRERWWGVEVEFPPALDEIFGVTNNKQAALHFTEVGLMLDDILSEADSIPQLKEMMAEDEDPRGPLVEIMHLIQKRLSSLRSMIKVQTKGSDTPKRYDDDSPEAHGTDATRTRQAEGHRGASDADEALPADERELILVQELVDTGLSEEQASELAAHTVKQDLKFAFTDADLEGRIFFSVKSVAGEILIKLNINHPAYRHLVEVLEDDPDRDLEKEELLDRLTRANRGLRLLLMAWARFEDEAYPDSKKRDIQDLRHDWGIVAADFLRNDE